MERQRAVEGTKWEERKVGGDCHRFWVTAPVLPQGHMPKVSSSQLSPLLGVDLSLSSS